MTRTIKWQLAAVLGGLLSIHCGPTSPTGTGGTGGTGGSGGTGGGSGGLPPGGERPAQLPSAVGTCPTLRTGANTITLNGVSMTWQLNVGQRVSGTGGPIIIYWHGTGTNAAEVNTGFGSPAIQEVVNLGGVVASPEATSNTGSNTGDNVWFRGDFSYADQIVACAMQQLNIDARHIHTLGYSAGGLQASAMAYDRSGYVAAIGSYSGGKLFPNAQQDPNFLPPAMLMHGPQGSDVFIIDFYDTSHAMEDEYKSRGFFAIDCEDTDSHISFTLRLGQAPYVWEFFKAHPYKVQPYPWLGGLPADFPSRCKIVAP